MYLVYWEDPEDHDSAMNRGFEEFPEKQGVIDWLNNIVKTRPKINPKIYGGAREISVVVEKVATRFRFA